MPIIDDFRYNKKRIIFITLYHSEMESMLRRYKYKLPPCVNKREVYKWHKGNYYGYGEKDGWVPLNEKGGMAFYAFSTDTFAVKFPKRISKELDGLIENLTNFQKKRRQR